MDQVYMYMQVCIGVFACSEFICMCVCCCGCICMDRVYMYKRVSIGVYACIKFICICKLFTSVYAFITNIRCIGMDFKLVCMCISYIYIYILNIQ